MQQKLKKILTRILVILAVLAVGAGILIFDTNHAKREVLVSSSGNGGYQLTVYQIGDADWPFGAAHCRADLREGKKVILEYPFDLSNDGKIADENNFRIAWDEDHVTLLAMAEEQADRYYAFSFDGKTASWISPVKQQSSRNEDEPVESTEPETADPNDVYIDRASEAIRKVYGFLKAQRTYSDLALFYDTDAKGSIYAVIRHGSEEIDGETVPYEMRLYDNGNDHDNQDMQEIVLEKAYPDSGRDNVLIDFYLVDPENGDVIDEHRNTW